MATLMLALLLCLTHSLPCKCAFDTLYHSTKPSQSNPNYGIIFRPIHKHFIATDMTHDLFFHLKFPRWPNLPNMPTLDPSACSKLIDKPFLGSTAVSNVKRNLCKQGMTFIQEFKSRYIECYSVILHSLIRLYNKC